MPDPIQFNPHAPDAKTYLKKHEMDLASGHLGKVFGTSPYLPIYLCGVSLFITLAVGAVVIVHPGGSHAIEVWKVLSPIITGALGFACGTRFTQ